MVSKSCSWVIDRIIETIQRFKPTTFQIIKIFQVWRETGIVELEPC